MLICPHCGAAWGEGSPQCRGCAFTPGCREGFVDWRGGGSHVDDGLPAASYALLERIEAEHFWFRSRRELIVWALRRYFPGFDSLLEVGCGTGFVLAAVAAAFPDARLCGSELAAAGLTAAARRVPGARWILADGRRLPYAEEFEVVGAFDVLEHVKDDHRVLAALFRSVKPGGGCLITVPQHRRLWSAIDELAGHERRYEADELHRRIEAAGFRILMSTSFVSLLLPGLWLSRLSNRPRHPRGELDELRPAPALNGLLQAVMTLERLSIRAGARWPLGGSRLVVGRKPTGGARSDARRPTP